MMRVGQRFVGGTQPMIVTVQVNTGDEVILPFPDDTNGNSAGWYDVYVDWGDGSPISHVTAPNRTYNGTDNPDARHTYTASGEFDITLKGKMRKWVHSNNDDENNMRLYLKDIKQFGSNVFETLGFAQSLLLTTLTETDGAKFMETGASLTFQGCSNFNSHLNHWNMANIVSLYQCFKDCHSFNQPLDNWYLPRVENLKQFAKAAWQFNRPLFILKNKVNEIDVEEMLNDTRSFKQGQNIGKWNFHNIKNLKQFKASYYDRDDINHTNYENILIAADNGGLSNGIIEIQSKYNADSAGAIARDNLINKGWTVNDRGAI